MRKAPFFSAFLPLVYHRKTVDEHRRQNIGDESRSECVNKDTVSSIAIEVSRPITAYSILSVLVTHQTASESIVC